MRRPFWLVAILLTLTLGCARAATVQTEEAARAVVEKFLVARQERNLDATMDCFAAQPELRSSLGVSWSGRDVVRAIMASRLTDTYSVGAVRVADNRVTWSENVRRRVPGAPVAATFDEDVEAIVVDNHIASLVTYVGGAHPAAQPEVAAQWSAGRDLLVPFSILLLVAAAVMAWPPATPLQPRRVTNGHLLNGLRDYVARRG